MDINLHLIIKKYKKELILYIFSIIIFYVIHLTPFVNRVYNSDSIGIFHVIEPIYHFSMLGRYVRALIDLFKINLGYNYIIPYFNFLIAALFYSLSIVLLAKIFNFLDLSIISIFFSLFFITHPFLSFTLCYFHDVETYSFACFIGTYVIYFIYKNFDNIDIKKIIVIVFLNIISTAILQSYFMYISTLMLILLFKKLVNKKYDFYLIFMRSIQLLISLILTIIIYFIVLYLLNNIFKISNESRLNNINLNLSLRKFIACFASYFLLFITEYSSFNLTLLSKLLYFFSTFLIFFYFFKNLFKKELGTEKIIFGLLFIILIPISNSSLRFLFVMSASTIISYVSYDILFFTSLNFIFNKYKFNTKKIIFILFFVLIFIFHRIYFTELRYELMYNRLEQMKIFSNVLANRIKNVDEYNNQIPIYISINKDVVNNNISNKFVANEFKDSFLSDEDYLYWWSFPSLLNMYGGITNNIYMDDKNIYNIKMMDDYKKMKTYPDEESIKIINGKLIVKID